MASNSDNNLLIDWDAPTEMNLPGENNSIQMSSSQKTNDECNTTVTDSVSLFRSAAPLYQLLSSNGMGSIDSADNNPFDRMDKQAGLFDDPFEIVENAAKAVLSTQIDQNVKTGKLVSLDSLDMPSPSTADQETIKTQNSVQMTNARKDETTPPATTIQNAFCGMLNMSTPLSRCSAKTKSRSLHLLKFSLSNNRMDSTSDNGSPISGDPESSSADEYATVLHQKMLNSKTLMLRPPNTDESFDDLSATKPNWVDSDADIENDGDVDSDIARLNIPMLNEISNECSSNDAGQADASTSAVKVNDSKSKEILTRDKLMEKLASIKFKLPSPTAADDNKNGPVDDTHDGGNDKNDVLIVVQDDTNPISKNACSRSANSTSLKAETPNSLIQNLKRIVEQCDDKQKQLEAKTLLESLSTIFTYDRDKSHEAAEKSLPSFERTPPQPIIRQGTFNIDSDQRILETNSKNTSNLTAKSMDKSKSQSPSDASTIDPALSQVLKGLQNVLGNNQCVNVVHTNIQQQNADGTSNTINPTYIVVMGASSNDTNSEIGTPQRNVTHRMYRSHSFSSRERPVAAISAAQVKIEQLRQPQTPSACRTPMRRPTLTRRSSFGSITQVNSSDQTAPTSKPSTTIVRRRSLQGPLPNSSLRPPSPKSSFTAKSTVPLNYSVPPSDTVSAKRRTQFGAMTATSKDSPSKMKSSYGIIKKPQAPPLVRNLKIRVKESLTGRSLAPMRAVVPMNRVAPLMMINESVSPIDEKRRKGLITSTPRSLAVPSATRDTSIKGK